MGMAIALFCIGAGAIHWAKTLMPDEEVVVQRHEFRSDDEDRSDFVKTVKEGAENAGLGFSIHHISEWPVCASRALRT